MPDTIVISFAAQAPHPVLAASARTSITLAAAMDGDLEEEGS
jgi:hypothetical protein